MLTEGTWEWHCKLCEAVGHGGPSAFTTHYAAVHIDRGPTYLSFLQEARNEHGLIGAAAYEWAHAAWSEYEKNQ